MTIPVYALCLLIAYFSPTAPLSKPTMVPVNEHAGRSGPSTV